MWPMLEITNKRLLKLRTKIRNLIFPVKIPANWDENEYFQHNPDVRQAVESGLVASGFEHWRKRGAFEGRKLSAQAAGTPVIWDEEAYLCRHPDVREAVERGDFASGLEHWQRYGRIQDGKKVVAIPDWLKHEMLEVSAFEPKLFPSTVFCQKLRAYYPGQDDDGTASRLFVKILENIGTGTFTHVFLVPWLKTGGTDIESLHHITTLSSQFDARILIILTENSDSPWVSRLPRSVTVLHFGRLAADTDDRTAQLVLVRLLLKLKPAVIHNIHSAIGWKIFSRYGAALHSVSKLYISLLLFDYTPEGEPVGYARQLETVYQYLEGIFSDNQAFTTELIQLYGVRPDLFSVLRYPVRVNARFSYAPDDRPRILWAGRLDRQKRPDILCRIARSLPDCIFHVFGATVLESMDFSRKALDELNELKNVVLFGAYDGFDSIPAANYALFLYTSQWDGMPNVILEALASGLVVVAPDVGGIREVVSPSSGFLISRCDDVDAYTNTIQHLLREPQLILEERKRKLRLMSEKYSPEQFAASLRALSSYSLTDRSAVSHDDTTAPPPQRTPLFTQGAKNPTEVSERS